MTRVSMLAKSRSARRRMSAPDAAGDGSGAARARGPIVAATKDRIVAMAAGFVAAAFFTVSFAMADDYPPDSGQPGDAMIQAYLAKEAQRVESRFLSDVDTKEKWLQIRPRLKQEYLTMLGLWPTPERTPLKPVVTRRLARDGYAVENLHFQSRPGLYVTGNLYRPTASAVGERLPAVLYVCGHSNMGRDGNKVAYQGNPIWFAKHGYVCLAIDTLQLGEVAGIHHGTYRENRWWWHSRGYTPAGVECWNGVRAIDYLTSREDVDPQRIGVTGISGGGAATIWIAAADERVAVAAPISGMADLESYVGHRVVNGHCDCMFLHNQYAWSWATIAALFAPRPLLFINSDQDPIFPMDANERVVNRLERAYSLFGASDQVDALVSVGGHAYRQDIRQGVYRFFNTHFRNDPRPINDSESDLVVDAKSSPQYPIPPRELRVFPDDADLPRDAINHRIDEFFVPRADVPLPRGGEFAAWKEGLFKSLSELPLAKLSQPIPQAREISRQDDAHVVYETEPGIRVTVHRRAPADKTGRQTATPTTGRCWLWVGEPTDLAGVAPEDSVYWCEPRGTGATTWTMKNPPNYVARAHALIGQTVDAGRILDIVAVAKALDSLKVGRLCLAGSEGHAALAAYAALLVPEVECVVAINPPATHQADGAPQLLSALRVCDIPDVFGMLAPRTLELWSADEKMSERVRGIYAAAAASERLSVRKRP